MVLCHGWPEHAYSWRHQIEPLVNAGYHVIAPNQRGYGHSTKPEALTDYDIEHLAGDLVAYSITLATKMPVLLVMTGAQSSFGIWR